jgi:aspartate carbamoyltransferase catalytic subunit
MIFSRKDFLSTQDLSKSEILSILDKSQEFFELNKQDVKKSDKLRGKTVINVFFENSTRTRTSFEIAAKRLSADAVNFSAASSSTQKGETLVDTIQNMQAMNADILVIRHEYSGAVKFVAENTESCIINAGDGLNEHPSQAMLDLFTIRKAKNRLEGLNVTIIGDISHSRVARSNIWAMKTMGMNIKLFAPPTVIPNDMSAFGCEICPNIESAVQGADVIITLRIQRERQGKLLIPSLREYSLFFGLTPDVMKLAPNAIVLHPGPINRGVELSSYVANSENSVILDQVEGGVAVRMALLSMVKK